MPRQHTRRIDTHQSKRSADLRKQTPTDDTGSAPLHLRAAKIRPTTRPQAVPPTPKAQQTGVGIPFISQKVQLSRQACSPRTSPRRPFSALPRGGRAALPAVGLLPISHRSCSLPAHALSRFLPLLFLCPCRYLPRSLRPTFSSSFCLRSAAAKRLLRGLLTLKRQKSPPLTVCTGRAGISCSVFYRIAPSDGAAFRQ